jgi:serine/threonine protein kinase
MASLNNDDSYLGIVLKQRYMVEKELGRGNIGIVYLALDQQLHSRPVAIKVLLEKSLQNPWFKKKLAQEVEALARIDHPGIVEVLDRGETPDGNPFIVMKFIRGRSLRSLIKNGGLEFKQVAKIIRQIGQGLSAAHDQEVLHCDLKPENIMVQDLAGNEQQIKIVDFGVAKVRNSRVAGSADGTLVAGTPIYMAPEHLDGSPSVASDIFSFGVIAYELLTGERPFKVNIEGGQKEAIRRGPEKRPKDLRLELPTAAQEIILKALSFEQNDRYHHARDFGELLAQALTTDLELPSRVDSIENLDLEMAHVLFMDIVGYSKLPTERQSEIYSEINGIVGNTSTFRRARASKQMISRSTGDGMALVFFSGPIAPVQCAMEIARSIYPHPHIKLRMGVNSGPVYRVKDMNEMEDVAGAGINMAQRVMDCGDAGHILVSKSVADVLKELVDWRNHLHNLGGHRVKHGVRIHLFNLYAGEIGNPNLPEKLRQKLLKRVVLAAISVFILITITLAIIFPRFSTQIAEAISPSITEPPVVTPAIERSLSYSVRVQKYRNGQPFEPPFQLAGADIVFEKDYRLKLNFNSQQPGYFYVLNEPPVEGGSTPDLIVLHASTKSSDTTVPLNLEFPQDMWLKFDRKRGTEKIWLVWSAQKVAVFESVKGLDNPQDDGRIKDPNQAKAVYVFLNEHSESRPVTAEDKEKKVTHITAKGELLVYPLELQHW